MLDLQLGPCRIDLVTKTLARIEGGGDRPGVVAAIKAAGGALDGTKRCWWLPVSQLHALTRHLKHERDFFASREK